MTTLLWDGPTSGPEVESYNVYIATNSGGTNYQLRGSTTDTEIPLAALGLTPGETYWARVTSVGTTGLESAPSQPISFTY